jgi:TonB family protein
MVSSRVPVAEPASRIFVALPAIPASRDASSIEKMPAARPAFEDATPAPVPRLLVELPSWPRVFFGNLRDLIFPRRHAALRLQSSPAEFWPDVFVRRPLPWGGFFQSTGYHLIAGALLIALTRLFAMQPRVVATPAFDHSQVIYYNASEYLPPLDTREPSPSRRQKADPELSRQPIISVPAAPDNRGQTIVIPPKFKLKHDVAMPNIVAWADAQRPQLAIPAAPLIPAAEIKRMAPPLQTAVVTPPPDAARLAPRRNSPTLESSVVAPPPELRAANSFAVFEGLKPGPIAPPPSVENTTARRLGDLNIGRSAVIAPAPQLPVAEQRIAPGRGAGASGLAPQVVPPPPSASGGALSGASFGSRGRVIALNLHPAAAAPPDPPAGNRRAAFAATPEGHAAATGTPGASATAPGNGNGGTTKKAGSDLPAGLYVGSTAAKASPVAGDPAKSAPAPAVNPNLLARARPPRVTSDTRTMQPASAEKLSDAERAVFGNRKFYSVTLNMPNLNSAGGSWVIRFAELSHDSSAHGQKAPPADLSQPMPMRKVDPVYPLQLMKENVAGTVILYAVIHADGSVGNVRVLRGVDERLDRFATEAVAQWKFDPATKNGSPVDVEATFQIPFKPTRTNY